MKSPTYLIFYICLIFGSLLTISSSSWFSAWMGLEMNMLSFIPIMSNDSFSDTTSSEAALKYFLIQAIASIVMLFFMILYLMNINLLLFMNNEFQMKTTIMLALLMKSSAAPFHFWFPSVMENMSWVNTMILISWQKIAPLILMNFIMVNWMFYCSIILSSMISTISVLNTTSLRKIMAYSSINHLSWMMMAMLSSETIFFMYFIFYSFLSLTMIINFKLLNLFYLNQMFYLFNFKWVNMYFSINMLSLGGLPPLTGFMPKMMVINTSIFHLHILLPLLVIIFTLIMLFTYLQISFSSLILNYWMNNSYQINTNKIKFNIYNKINYISFISFTINALLMLFILSFSMNTMC